MNLKKTLALALLALGAVGVSACGSEEKPAGEQTTGDGETTKYSVAFNANGKATNPTTLNDVKVLPTLPDVSADGFTFDGWYYDEGLTQKATAGDQITANVVLYAKWTAVDTLATAKASAKNEIQAYALAELNKVVDATHKATLTPLIQNKLTELKNGIDAATDEATINILKITNKDAIDKLIQSVVNPPADISDGKINDADEFLEMLNQEEGTFTLENDIDLTSVAIPAASKEFRGTIDGNGHKVIFNKDSQISVAGSKGMLFLRLNGATIKNITLKDVNIKGTGDTVSIFGNAIGTVTFENVLIDGAKAEFVRYSGLLLGKTGANLTLKNVAAVNYNVTAGDYSGVLISTVTSATAAYSKAATEAAGSLDADNILLDGIFAGGSQCEGGVVGYVDNKIANQKVDINGVVVKGKISGGKNVGAVIGSVKATDATVTVSNVLALDLEVNASTVLTPVDDTKVGIAYGLCSSSNTISSIVAINPSTKILAGTTNLVEGKANSVVKVANATAPTTAFTIADGKISLGTLATVNMPASIVESEVASGVIADGNETDLATATVVDNKITFGGTIEYYHKNSDEVTNAGNAVALKVTAATGVDTTGATISVNGNTGVPYTSGEVFYLPVVEEDLTKTTTITIKWSDAAIAQDYTVLFATGTTLEAAPTYGAISNADSNTELVATADGDTLTYTAGEVAWDAENKGNFVTVKVSKPAWVTDASGVTATGATIVGTPTASDTEITLKVKVAAPATSFKVQWSSKTDAKTYNIAFSGATLAANPNAANIKTITAEEVLTAAGIATDDTGKGVAINAGTYAGLILNAGSKRANSSTLSIEVAKEGGSSIGFTTTGASTITISASSTGKTNTSDLALYDASGNLVGSVQTISGSDPKDLTFNVTAAGTYYIMSKGGTNTGRGARVCSVTIEKTA